MTLHGDELGYRRGQVAKRRRVPGKAHRGQHPVPAAHQRNLFSPSRSLNLRVNFLADRVLDVLAVRGRLVELTEQALRQPASADQHRPVLAHDLDGARRRLLDDLSLGSRIGFARVPLRTIGANQSLVNTATSAERRHSFNDAV